MNPVITAIVPTFRRPLLLRRAIRSILRQTFPDFKICVYDNASGDETEAVVSELAEQDSRVIYFRHPKNIGARANFQFGIDRVETPFFSVLCDDDVVLPDFYQIAMRGFSEHPEAVFSGGLSVLMLHEDKVFSFIPSDWRNYGLVHPPQGLFAMLGRHVTSHMAWTSVIIRTETMKSIGRMESGEGVPCDADLSMQMAARFPFYFIDRPLAIYSVHRSNMHQMSNLLVRYYGWAKVLGKIARDPAVPESARDTVTHLCRRQLKIMLSNFWSNAIINRNYKEARMLADILRDEFHASAGSYFRDLAASLFQRYPGLNQGYARFKTLHFRNVVKYRELERELKEYLRDLA